MTADEKLREHGASCVVVGDASRVRLLFAAGPLAALEEVGDLANPEARLHEGDLVADASGHMPGSMRGRAGSAVENGSMKQHRVERFAGDVCARLRALAQERSVERIYLVAEPGFLGLLRRGLHGELERRVAGTVSKSIAGWDPGDIRAELPRRL